MSSLRTFRAASVADALALVRRELGQEAVILGQREIRKRRFPWQRATVETELTAALGPHRPAAAVPREDARGDAFDRRAAGEVAGNTLEINRSFFETPLPGSAGPRAVEPPTSRELLLDPFRIYTQLIERDVDEADAREVVAELRRRRLPATQTAEGLAAIVRDMLPCRGAVQVTPGRQRVVALVGATGVGKTTTVAKLAANFRLKDMLRVGLITVDTYRVAAVDQLQTYANLIDVPMQVVNSPREMRQAIDDLSAMDLVLIDTAGRSPQDELRIQELRSFLQAARADEVHLVVSLNAARRNIELTAERFQRIGPTSLLLTKLDEAPGPGAILTAARRTSLPLSYLTTGQDVPEDIEAAAADRLVSLILGLESPSKFDGTAAAHDRADGSRGEQRFAELPGSPERQETEPAGHQSSAEFRWLERTAGQCGVSW